MTMDGVVSQFSFFFNFFAIASIKLFVYMLVFCIVFTLYITSCLSYIRFLIYNTVCNMIINIERSFHTFITGCQHFFQKAD